MRVVSEGGAGWDLGGGGTLFHFENLKIIHCLLIWQRQYMILPSTHIYTY